MAKNESNAAKAADQVEDTKDVQEVKNEAQEAVAAKQAPVSDDVLDFGTSIGKNVESKLRFKPRPELKDLTQGRLVSCEIKILEAPMIDKKTGLPSTWEYRGLPLPNLHLTFIQEKTTEDPAERVLDLYIGIYAGVDKTGTPLKPASIKQHYQFEYLRLRHIANAFVNHSNYVEFENVAFNPFLEPIERVKQVTAYYEAWAKVFKGKVNGGYVNQLCNIKVVASSTGTYLTIPDYVGSGFIEKHVDGRVPTIELKPGESVVLVEKKKGATKGKGEAGTSNDAGSSPAGDAISPELADIYSKYLQQG